jgi:hypothetical protein
MPKKPFKLQRRTPFVSGREHINGGCWLRA